jgi:hypothetical protein
MLRTAATLSLLCAAATATIGSATLAESLVPITTCTLTRMRIESYLLLARAAVIVLPFVGLVLAGLARRAGRRVAWAAALNAMAALYVVGAVARLLPVNHFGCLRS